MSSSSIRVLIVDDSPLIRTIIADHIEQTPGVSVVGQAANGREALALFASAQPDVVTLDIEMPVMNGLETLAAILAKRPVPVIMVSSLTRLGADITLEALELGALDYVAKPDGALGAAALLGQELTRKILSVAGADVANVMQMRERRAAQRAARRTAREAEQQAKQSQPATAVESCRGALAEKSAVAVDYADKLIAIGISTGGPPALASLFETLRGPLPPIVVVQHMPAQFTKAFAARLDRLSQLEVKEAATGDILQPGRVYIAAGGQHLWVRPHPTGAKLYVGEGEPVSGHRPSVDVMMGSAARLYRDRCLGVIMTGMGRDGSHGCQAIRAAGGYVLGQDEATSDVYGMNKVAYADGNVDRQFSLEDAPLTISQQVKRLWAPALAGR